MNHFLGFDECKDLLEEDMRLHLLGFLYDVRHAYQGDRNIKAVDNGLLDEQKEYYGIAKSVKKDVLYDFNYVVTELMVDMVLFKHFVKKNTKKISEYDTNYNVVMSFYSKVIDALKEVLTQNQTKKVRQRFVEARVSEKNYPKQWLEIVSVDYMKMTKAKRKKEIMHKIQEICDPYLFDECLEIMEEAEEYAKKNNIYITQVTYVKYPYELEW